MLLFLTLWLATRIPELVLRARFCQTNSQLLIDEQLQMMVAQPSLIHVDMCSDHLNYCDLLVWWMQRPGPPLCSLDITAVKHARLTTLDTRIGISYNVSWHSIWHAIDTAMIETVPNMKIVSFQQATHLTVIPSLYLHQLQR